MAGDYLKLYRKLKDSRVGSDIRLTGFWVHLLMRTNWRRSFFARREIFPGQLVFSQAKLAKELKMHRNTVARWLRLFEGWGMLTIEKRGHHFSVITICNWETYQGNDREAGATRGATRGATETESCAPASATYGACIQEGEESKKGKNISPRLKNPSLEEVEAYCRERANGIDPEAFHAFYEANGWVQGRSGKPIKNWKMAVITWEKNNLSKKPANDVEEVWKNFHAKHRGAT